MNNQKVTYPRSSEFETRLRFGGSQKFREANDKVGIGILCSLLLVAITLHGIQIVKYSQENNQLKENYKNLSQEYHILNNYLYLKEEMLKNKTLEYENLQQQKEQDALVRERNTCYGETTVALNCVQRTDKPFKGHWFCCGRKCYYFFMERKRWQECKQTCQDCSSSILRIDDNDELNFLMNQVSHNSYWIGLSYDPRERKWKWADNGTSRLNGLSDVNCQDQSYPCVCEKRMDESCGPLCKKKST